MNDFATQFAEACRRYRLCRAEIEAVDARNRAGWEANPDWRTTFDLHAEMMSRLPSERAEAVIDAMFPEINAKMAVIIAHRDAHILERENAHVALRAARAEALELLGVQFGLQVVEANPEPHELEGAIDEAYSEAQAIRKLRLDGLRLAFDEEGPFTKALYGKIAEYLEIPVRGKRWMHAVTETIRGAAAPRRLGF